MSYQHDRRGPFRPWLAVVVVLVMLAAAVLGRSDTVSSTGRVAATGIPDDEAAGQPVNPARISHAAREAKRPAP